MGCGYGDFNESDFPEVFGLKCRPCRKGDHDYCKREHCPCKHDTVKQPKFDKEDLRESGEKVE